MSLITACASQGKLVKKITYRINGGEWVSQDVIGTPTFEDSLFLVQQNPVFTINGFPTPISLFLNERIEFLTNGMLNIIGLDEQNNEVVDFGVFSMDFLVVDNGVTFEQTRQFSIGLYQDFHAIRVKVY